VITEHLPQPAKRRKADRQVGIAWVHAEAFQVLRQFLRQHNARSADAAHAAFPVRWQAQDNVESMPRCAVPRMDGWEAVRRLRDQAGLQDTLIIAETGFSTDEDRQRSREAGFDQHMVKPIELDELERFLIVSA
jgi:CheY-like chemotaxis protein